MPECQANLCIVLHLSPCVVCMYVHRFILAKAPIEYQGRRNRGFTSGGAVPPHFSKPSC